MAFLIDSLLIFSTGFAVGLLFMLFISKPRRDAFDHYIHKGIISDHCQWLSRDFGVFDDYCDWVMSTGEYKASKPLLPHFREQMKDKYAPSSLRDICCDSVTAAKLKMATDKGLVLTGFITNDGRMLVDGKVQTFELWQRQWAFDWIGVLKSSDMPKLYDGNGFTHRDEIYVRSNIPKPDYLPGIRNPDYISEILKNDTVKKSI